MISARSGVLLATGLLALMTFAAVQDRVTAANARGYAASARAAIAEGKPAPAVEAVMAPAIRRSVQWATVSAGAVVLVGIGVARIVRGR